MKDYNFLTHKIELFFLSSFMMMAVRFVKIGLLFSEAFVFITYIIIMGNKTRQKTGIKQLGDDNRNTDVSIHTF